MGITAKDLEPGLPSQRTLLIGYGNLDRQDDGVAWHVLNALSHQLGKDVVESEDDLTDTASGDTIDLLYVLQLTPELAETLTRYERVCFIDAHTENIPHEVNFSVVKGEFQPSPFTHHMSPGTCLSICQTLYHHSPEAILVSIRGYEFGFVASLSSLTQKHAAQAVTIIDQWLKKGM